MLKYFDHIKIFNTCKVRQERKKESIFKVKKSAIFQISKTNLSFYQISFTLNMLCTKTINWN